MHVQHCVQACVIYQTSGHQDGTSTAQWSGVCLLKVCVVSKIVHERGERLFIRESFLCESCGLSGWFMIRRGSAHATLTMLIKKRMSSLCDTAGVIRVTCILNTANCWPIPSTASCKSVITATAVETHSLTHSHTHTERERETLECSDRRSEVNVELFAGV